MLDKIREKSKSLALFYKYSEGMRNNIAILLTLNITNMLISLSLPIITKQVIDSVTNGDLDSFIRNFIIYVLVSVVVISVNSYHSFKATYFGNIITNHLQSSFLEKFYTMEWIDSSKFHSGDIVARVTRDIGGIVNFYVSTLPGIITMVIQMAVAFSIIIYFDFILGVYGLAIIPIIVIISTFFGKRIKPKQNEINKKEGNYRAYLTEIIQKTSLIKTFQAENFILNKVRSTQENKMETVLDKKKIIVKANLVIRIAFSASAFIAFGFGAYRIYLGILTYGTFMAIIQLLNKLQSPLMGFSKMFPSIITSISAVERLEELSFTTEQKEHKNIFDIENFSIQVRNLTFSYDGANNVIKKVNVDINPGEKVVIIGESGIGKTTFLKLIMNLIQPDEGTIRTQVNNIECDNHPSYYTYVPQENLIFSGTIRENLLLGKNNATDEEINTALDIACARSFICKLPNGIESEIGENGLGYSEGQLQRISIARALLRDAPILLLDEATSALDIETEESVISNIKEAFPKRTLIAITHRPSILSIADKVIHLEKSDYSVKTNDIV